MAFYVGSTLVANTQGVYAPSFTSTTRPASPVTGQVIYNSTTGQMEMYDGSNWRLAVNERSFLYRQVITQSYVMGGYRATVPWRNVNRMVHATDVMTNLGDQIDRAESYTSGVCSLTKGFLWATENGPWPGTSSVTAGFNMATETTAGTSSAWNLNTNRNDCGTLHKEHQFAYIIGGGAESIDVFNLLTETMISGFPGPNGIVGSSSYQYGIGVITDEDSGHAWTDGQRCKLVFSTITNYTVAIGQGVYGNSGQQKGISSKHHKGWAGAEGNYNGGNNLNRWNLKTDTSLGAVVSKPITNSGEENLDMGQYHQYMMGMYDGDQNNRGWKFNYASESGSELGSGSLRTGVPGGSSGHCVWKG